MLDTISRIVLLDAKPLALILAACAGAYRQAWVDHLAGSDPQTGSPRLAKIREQYERAPEPEELVILDGAAHAQQIFATDPGDRLKHEILRFLSGP